MNSFDPDKNYYAVLGIAPGATKRHIELAYKGHAKRHHPDLGGEEEQMKAVNEAYCVLQDEATRLAYDAARKHKEPSTFFVPVRSRSAAVDVAYGQSAGAIICVLAGVVLLLLVRFHWIWVLWPLAVLAGLVILGGGLMARNVMFLLQRSLRGDHPLRRFPAVPEVMFWSAAAGLAYGVYLLLSSF